MDLKCGDIIACKNKSWLSRIIQLITNSKYSHTAIVYDVWDCDTVLLGEINWNYTYCIREMMYDGYDIYRYNGDIDKHKIQHEIIKMGGTRYGFSDIFRIFFKLSRKYTPSKVICSEVIDLIYSRSGYDLMIDVNSPTPQEVIESKMLHRVK